MLSSLVKEHSQRQAVRKEHQEALRQEAVKSAAELTEALVDHLNVGVAQAYLTRSASTLKPSSYTPTRQSSPSRPKAGSAWWNPSIPPSKISATSNPGQRPSRPT